MKNKLLVNGKNNNNITNLLLKSVLYIGTGKKLPEKAWPTIRNDHNNNL